MNTKLPPQEDKARATIRLFEKNPNWAPRVMVGEPGQFDVFALGWCVFSAESLGWRKKLFGAGTIAPEAAEDAVIGAISVGNPYTAGNNLDMVKVTPISSRPMDEAGNREMAVVKIKVYVTKVGDKWLIANMAYTGEYPVIQ